MAQLANPEDHARYILAIFKNRGVRPGEILSLGVFNTYVDGIRFRADDFNAGATFGISNGWFEHQKGLLESLRLTDVGFAEI